MKYHLIKPINESYSPIEQILTNRGIAREEISHYLYTTDADVAQPDTFGLDLMRAAAAELLKTINQNLDAIIIVDSDCDGFTSSALLWNYLWDIFPTWAAAHLKFILHEGKQHGLSDHIKDLPPDGEIPNLKLILIPDAGSNDAKECKILSELGYSIIILDHHICDVANPYAIVINNQNSNYPNKELSGVGVTWQFCRFLDGLMATNYANDYLDLVALGLVADMMSLQSIETKHLVQKGLEEENIKNPFMIYMIEKNRYSLGDSITPMGIAFYVAPFVNALVRSGSMEEKELIFKSMLKNEAFQILPSTKRGHKAGDTEKLVEQAIRVATNVKARQTKAQDAGMEFLETKIFAEDLLSHKVLLFLLKPGEIDRNIAGLVANKLAPKYQRPCCILTRVEETDPTVPPWEETPVKRISYQGSARGCDLIGITDFKGMCTDSGQILYASGHPGAFGLGIAADNIPAFVEYMDNALADISDEPVYQVDYIWNKDTVSAQAILDIADLEALWGKNVNEPFIAIEHLKVSPDMVTIYDKKGYTIKIELPNGIALMLFRASEEDCAKLQYNNTGYVDLNIIAKCNKNEWMGNITAQLFIEDYEIIDSNKYFF